MSVRACIIIASISNGGNKMKKAHVVLLALTVSGCGNDNSANLTNSTAVQVNTGAGNKQSVNAVGSSAVQIQTGIGNQQSANLRNNSSASQLQTGIANRQFVNLDRGQSVSQNQIGAGNTQKFEFGCDKNIRVKGATQNQAGFLNNQTMRIGGATCDEQKQSEKASAQLPTASESVKK
jgi:hypothetical protein